MYPPLFLRVENIFYSFFLFNYVAEMIGMQNSEKSSMNSQDFFIESTGVFHHGKR